MVDSLLQLSGIRHELAEIEPPLMEQGLSPNVEVKCCFFCARTRDNIVDIRGVEKESNKCFIALQEILQMVPKRCIKQKGMEDTPNTTLVNLNTCISGSALVMSSIQRNLRTSLSQAMTEIMRNAFSRSAVKAILYDLNVKSRSSSNWLNVGPFWRQSFNQGPLDLAEASYTTRSLVVILSVHTMA